VLLERHREGRKFDDLRAGMICSITANANRGKGQKAYKPEDFFPSLKAERKEMTAKQMLAHVKRAHVLLGGE
jgi:hypothetical protein